MTLHGKGLAHEDLLTIMGELDDLLLPYTIDLSLFADLTQEDLIDHIRRVGMVFYEIKPEQPRRGVSGPPKPRY